MNKAIIMGRFGQDPELRRTANDIPVTSFSIAVNGRPRPDGTRRTDWIDCVAWRHTAEFICKYFSKGSPILIEGSIQTGSYEDKSGNKRKTTEVLVDQVEFCGGKNENQSQSGNYNQGNQNSSYDDNQQFGSSPTTFESGSDDDFSVIAADDDLPF